MPNKPEENQLAMRAFKLIEARYGKYFDGNASIINFSGAVRHGTDKVEGYVKFRDHEVFINNFSYDPEKRDPGAGCVICGFTTRSRAGNQFDREIYINRLYANGGTVVHEMLHFLTHRNFLASVNFAIKEAVTEFFTRKVMKPKSNEDFDRSQRHGRYDLQHRLLKETKDRKGEDRFFLRRAYFQGDLKAITFVVDQLKDLASEVDRIQATQNRMLSDFAKAGAAAADESGSQQPSATHVPPPRPPRPPRPGLSLGTPSATPVPLRPLPPPPPRLGLGPSPGTTESNGSDDDEIEEFKASQFRFVNPGRRPGNT
jgi:hypothetical protein